MTMAKGYRLKTSVLEYVGGQTVNHDSTHDVAGGAAGIIRTAAFVELESDKIKIQGQGMTYLIEPRVLRIHNNVEAQLYPAGLHEK
jgi:hypothetical protein